MNGSLIAVGIGVLLIVAAILVYQHYARQPGNYFPGLMAKAAAARARGKRERARLLYQKAAAEITQLPSGGAAWQATLAAAYVAIGEICSEENKRSAALDAYRSAVQLLPQAERQQQPASQPLLGSVVPDTVVRTVANEYASRKEASAEAIHAYLLYLSLGDSEAGDQVIPLLRELCSVEAASKPKRQGAVLDLAQRVLAVAPAIGWAHLAIGTVLRQRGQVESAAAALRKAEQIDRQLAAAPLQLALLQLTQGNASAAEAAFRRSLLIDSQQPNTLFQLAQLLHKKVAVSGPAAEKEATEARSLLAAAVGLAPQRAEIWHLRGQLEAAARNRDVALTSLRRAIALEPNTIEYQLTLVSALLSFGDKQAAIVALRNLDDSQRMPLTARQQLAELLLAQTETALKAKSKLDQPEPQNRQLLAEIERHYRLILATASLTDAVANGLGRTLYYQGRYGEAIKLLRQAHSLPPNGLFALGRAFAACDMTSEALATFNRCLDAAGPSAEVLFAAACARAQRGEWQEAIRQFAEAKKLAANEGKELIRYSFYHGLALLRGGNPAGAQAAFAEVEHEVVGDARLHYAIGLAALAGTAPEAAQQAFERSVASNPHYAPAHFAIGLLCERRGDLAAAETAYQSGLNDEPSWRPGQMRLGVVQARQQNWPAALKTLTPLVEDGQATDESLFYLGLSQAHSRNYAAALATWEPLRIRLPQDGRVRANRAAAICQLATQLTASGSYVQAVAWWQQGWRENPEQPAFRAGLVETLVRQGATIFACQDVDADEARAARLALEQALALSPTDERVHFYLGLNALRAGAAEEAVRHLRAALQQEPDSRRAAYYLLLALLAAGDAAGAASVLEPLRSTAATPAYDLDLAAGDIAAMQGEWAAALHAYSRALQPAG